MTELKSRPAPTTIDETLDLLTGADYVADRSLATVLFLSLRALTELDKVALDPETVSDTIGVLLKYQDDIARIEQGEGRRILNEVKAELSAAE